MRSRTASPMTSAPLSGRRTRRSSRGSKVSVVDFRWLVRKTKGRLRRDFCYAGKGFSLSFWRYAMVITLGPELEAALTEQARLQGIEPERVAVNALRSYFLKIAPPEPRDEWERRL